MTEGAEFDIETELQEFPPELRRQVRELVERASRVQAAEDDALWTKLSGLLTGVANALNGPPPPLVSWSWHDLPELAADAVTSLRECVSQLEYPAGRDLTHSRRLIDYDPAGSTYEIEERPWFARAKAVAARARRAGDVP